MDKHEFLVTLRRKLKKLDDEQINAAVNYYESYFVEHGDSQEVLEALDDPHKIASAIISSHAVNMLENAAKNEDRIKLRTSFKTAHLMINAIFTYPISFFGKASIFFILLILGIGYTLLFSCFWIFCVLIFVYGLIGIVSGIGVIKQDFISSLLAIGVGCFLSGFGLFSSVFFPYPIRKVTNIIFINFTNWCGRKMADLDKLESHVRGFINEKIKK